MLGTEIVLVEVMRVLLRKIRQTYEIAEMTEHFSTEFTFMRRIINLLLVSITFVNLPGYAQEKPLPPLVEMMLRPPKTTAANGSPQVSTTIPAPKTGLPPLEILPTIPPKTTPALSGENPAQPEQPKRKLPTLREQLQSVEDKQQEQHTTNDDLRKEIAEVKRSVEDLRRTVETLAPAAKKSPKKSSFHDLTAESSRQFTTQRDKRPGENVILPDGGKKTPGTEAHLAPKPSQSEPKSDVNPAANMTQTGQDAPATTPYREAMNFISKKKYGEAVPLLQQTLQTEKSAETQSGCYYWLGESNFGLGKYDEAIKNFQKVGVLKTSQKLDDAQIMIAESLYRKGDLAAAKAAFQRLIDVFPKSEYVARARRMLQEL